MLTIWTQAYNSEKYISQSIESVLQQSYTDFEYIIVDDGSTDGTWAIIQEYANQDRRIRAIHQENNSGGLLYDLLLDTVRGEYFAVLDSDDWLEPDFLQELFNFCKDDNLDMCVCGSHYLIESNQTKGVLRNPTQKLSFRFHETPKYFSTIHQFLRPIWGKLIRTEVVRSANLSLFKTFIAKKYKGFDTAFTIGVYENCDKIGMLNKCLHNYRVRDNSSFRQFSATRFEAYELLYQQTITLLSKFGPISPHNQRFTSLVFYNAIKDTFDICFHSSLSDSDKATYISNILGNPRVLGLRMRDFESDGLNILMPYIAWLLIKADGARIQASELKSLLTFLLPRVFEQLTEREWDSLLKDY